MEPPASIVIVGAGECGIRAALALREEGFDGAITLFGAETHQPYERPPLSKEALTASQAPQPKTIGAAGALDAAKIEWRAGTTVAAIDRQARTVSDGTGRTHPYGRLLLATGAYARRIAMPGADDARCRTLRTFDDALAIRAHLKSGRHLTILGGGFIGLELAASARMRGVAVTVIETQKRLLARAVPEEIAAIIEARHRAEGVDLRLGAGLAAITPTRTHLRLDLADGDRIETGMLVFGIGAVPQTSLAHSAGLAVDNGIVVDDDLRTSDPFIHAAGDCCAFPSEIYGGRRIRLEAWRNAQEQGLHAARAMLAIPHGRKQVPWFWSDQYDLTLQIAGLADEAVTTIRRPVGDTGFVLFHIGEDGRLLSASGIGHGNAVAKDIRLAEMLIASGARPAQDALASPSVKLKSLLAA